MRAIVITEAAPRGPVAPQVRTVDDGPDPGEPAAGELRVRTEASALNHMDLWVGRGIPGVDNQGVRIAQQDEDSTLAAGANMLSEMTTTAEYRIVVLLLPA